MFLLMGWFVISSSKREQLAGRALHVLGDVSISDIMRPGRHCPGLADGAGVLERVGQPLPRSCLRAGALGRRRLVRRRDRPAVGGRPTRHAGVGRAQDIALPLPSSPGGQAPLRPDQPALAMAGRPGAALPVVDHDATVGVVLAADIAAMVARGTPVTASDLDVLWPPAAAASHSA